MEKKPNKVCFLHIGIHKSGTTSIQTFSIANRDLLHQHGFLFPLSGCKVTEKNEYRAHHHIGWQLLLETLRCTSTMLGLISIFIYEPSNTCRY